MMKMSCDITCSVIVSTSSPSDQPVLCLLAATEHAGLDIIRTWGPEVSQSTGLAVVPTPATWPRAVFAAMCLVSCACWHVL